MEVDLSGTFQVLNASFIGFKKKEPEHIPDKSHVFYFAGSERSCLSCFILLQPQRPPHAVGGPPTAATSAPAASSPSSSPKTVEKVRMLWSYPLPPARVLMEYPNLAKFALATSGTSSSAEQLTYTFVLTDGKGVRKYGHCTTFVNGDAVVCVSPYPWCNFFYRIAYLFRTNGAEEGRRVIRALCNCPTPPSGAAFLTPPGLGAKFTRPYDRLCSFIDTSPLDMLTVFPDNDMLFSVLTDLLLEKHIIIVGPNFSLVSNVVMSLQAFIAPFDWVHILIPVLPPDLMDVLAAPPPYLVGILTSQLPLMDNVPVDSVVMVHLGATGVCEGVYYHNEEEDRLPHSGMLSAIRVGLSLLRLRNPRDQTVRDLCSLFMTYYASLFGEVVLRGAKGYIKSHNLSKATVAFYQKLLATQSFNILSEEVNKVISADNIYWMDNEFIVAIIRANPTIYPSHYAQLISEEKSGRGYVEKYEDCFGSKEEFNSLTAAIHGFGGHKFGVSRLLANCLCGRLCGCWDSAVQDENYEEASYRFFRGALADAGGARRRASVGLGADADPIVEAAEVDGVGAHRPAIPPTAEIVIEPFANLDEYANAPGWSRRGHEQVSVSREDFEGA